MVERQVALPGGTFHYLSATPPGREDAPLIVLFHGFPDHPYSFGPVMARFVEAGYRVAAPWMRGYRPSVQQGPYHIPRLARDVVEFVDALSPERPVFAVGHDWGAAALYGALADAPSRFTAAATMAVPHPQAFFQRLWRSARQLRKSWYMFFFQIRAIPERVCAHGDFSLIDRLWRMWSPGFELPPADRTILHACLRASMPAPIGYYRALLWPPGRAVELARSGPMSRSITVPVFYLHGARDGCIDPSISEGQESYFDALYERAILEHAGHFLQLEAPDLVAGYIIDWFQEFPGHA
ncbi:alpha/beta fold hydrolase [Haliangium ochraceum]|nr:alpha/beta fold hydrolase [Haliangium ochraceum]